MEGSLVLISIGSWDWVAQAIENEKAGINSMFTGINNILSKSVIYDKLIEGIPDEVKSAFGAIALTLITLFVLVDFIHKSMDLKWVTWENVLMFFIKIIIAKICVDNAEFIMSCIYKGFNSLTESLAGTITDIIPRSTGEGYEYFLSPRDVGILSQKPQINWYDFTPVGMWLLIIVQGFIMKAIMAVTLIITLARFMELTIYTIAAPLPLSTLACDGLQDIGKSYLKSYAACCIHAAILLLIFTAYSVLNTVLASPDLINAMSCFSVTGFLGIIKTFILGGTVMKSEQWSKRICGAL